MIDTDTVPVDVTPVEVTPVLVEPVDVLPVEVEPVAADTLEIPTTASTTERRSKFFISEKVRDKRDRISIESY